MKRRTRLIASGFTALAMTFSLGEAVLASMCVPGLDATAVDAADAAPMHGMPCCGPAEMRDVMTAGAEDTPGENCMHGAHGRAGSDPNGRDEAPCPFGPVAGAPGCGAAASLPAHTFDDLAASPETAMAVVSDHTRHSPSFASTLFHPPKP